MEQKVRFVVRLHIGLRRCIDEEAARRGIRPASLAGAMLERQALRARKTGELPHPLAEDYLPARTRGVVSAGPQMSLFVSPEAAQAVEALSEQTGDSVRRVIAGLLLNDPVCELLV